MIFTGFFFQDIVVKGLDKLPILPKSEIFYLNFETGTNDIQIQQIYRIGISTPLIFESFGFIRNDQFIDSRSSTITSRRRINLHGFNFRASMVITSNDTLNHLTDYR